MREHIKAFLLASSFAFGIPTFDLSEAQRDRVYGIFHEQANAMREQMKLVHRAHEALRRAALSPGFDRAQARSLADAAAGALSELALMRAETLSRVAAVLTPAQRDKLALFHLH